MSFMSYKHAKIRVQSDSKCVMLKMCYNSEKQLIVSLSFCVVEKYSFRQ